MDYDHNIPLAKKVCGGTEDDDKYLEEMLKKTAVSAKKNNLDLHVTKCCITLLAVALVRLHKGIKGNLSSVAYLT